MMNQQIIISNVCEQLADISASTQNESAQRKIQDIYRLFIRFSYEILITNLPSII